MAHLEIGDFPAQADVRITPEQRRLRSLQMLAAMACASFVIVGAAALFLAATY